VRILSRSKPATVVFAFVIAMVAAVALRMVVGPAGLGLPDGPDAWQLRGERVLSGVVVGSALALAGVLLQTLLRNPLASPDLIGPASGAGFAVMLSVYLTHSAGLALSGGATISVSSTAALIGAIGAIGLVYIFSQRRGFIEPVQLVLVGVVMSIMFGAGTMFLMYLMPDRGMSMSRWTIGALSDDAPRIVIVVGLLLVIAGIAAGTAACGATVVVLADAATRAIDLGSGRMPLGVITALCGGVTFIWIARRTPMGYSRG